MISRKKEEVQAWSNRKVLAAAIILVVLGILIVESRNFELIQSPAGQFSLEPRCQDNDGKNILFQGELKAFGTTFRDTCSNGSIVIEGFCEESVPKKELIQCPSGLCIDGACR